MKFYRRWVADYQADTAALSLIEHGAYTLLLDHCYFNASPLPADRGAIYRLCRAFERHERNAIDRVLDKHFTLSEDGYHNARADAEIARNHEYSEAQRERSALGVAARTVKEPKAAAAKRGNGLDHPKPALALPDWIDAPTFAAWIKIRPAKARTLEAQTAAIGKLDRMRGQGIDINEVLRTSLANGWQGIFAPDAKRQGAQQQQRNESGSAERPTFKCADCGERVQTWIGQQCFPCYRGEKRASA